MSLHIIGKGNKRRGKNITTENWKLLRTESRMNRQIRPLLMRGILVSGQKYVLLTEGSHNMFAHSPTFEKHCAILQCAN